jgi:hypothetical protein
MILHDRKFMNVRVHIDLRPRTDLMFRAAFERACVAASVEGAELDSPDAARIVEEELRSGGYPNAEISLFRSVEEYRNRVSNWVAWRDGRPRSKERNRHDEPRTDRVDRIGHAGAGE